MHNSDQWTDAKFNSFIKSALRAASRRWPPRFEILKEARTVSKTNAKTGRMAQHYRCAICKGEFPAKDVQVDHKFPIIDPTVGFVSWDVVINNMFCEKHNLQVLCTDPCHKSKTASEKQQSKERKLNDKTK